MTAPAHAQATTTTSTPSSPSDTVVVSPPVEEKNAAPGETLTTKITITNATSRERVFGTTLRNAVPQGVDGTPSLVPDEGPYALSSWLTVTPPTATIKAGASADFAIKIAVPKDAGPGSHSGAIVFSPSAAPTSGGAGVSVVAEVSSLLLINVSGEVKNGLKLDSFKADKSFYQRGPATFTALFTNNGNLVARPTGTVTIKNVFGKTISTLKVDPQRVLPTAQRKFEVTWDQKNLLGPYTATFAWNADSVSAEPNSVKIWGAPLKVIIPVLVVLVLMFLLLWLPRKRLKKAFAALREPAEPAKTNPPEPAKGAPAESVKEHDQPENPNS